MSKKLQPTYLERIHNRFKNNPIIAWLIVFATLILSLSALIPAIKSLVSELNTGENQPPLNITLTAYDPRFDYDPNTGNYMNWGGGSMRLFVETKSVPDKIAEYDYEVSYGIIERLKKDGDIERFWEVIPRGRGADGMRMQVNAVYDANIEDPTCIVLEWGIISEETELPSKGIFLTYKVGGGAYISPIGGKVYINENTGLYLISLWLTEEDDFNSGVVSHESKANPNKVRRVSGKNIKKEVQYLSPGEPTVLDINIVGAGLEPPIISNPKPEVARIIRVYARILVKGKEWIIKSRNAARVVSLNGYNDWQLESDDQIEDLRKSAYFKTKAEKVENLNYAKISSSIDNRSKNDYSNKAKIERKTIPLENFVEESKKASNEQEKESDIKSLSNLPTIDRKGIYTVQIGSFLNEEAATKMAESMNIKGYPAFVTIAKIAGRGTYYRVRIGTFNSKEKAKLYGNELIKIEPSIESVLVTKNN